jgi:probable lipoprotein NlpC
VRIYKPVLLFFFLITLIASSCRSSKNGAASKDKSSKNSSSKKKNKKTNSSSDSKTADKVIKTARSYMGTPYKYGGTSRAGLDCSGLTSISYQAADISLPRTSQQQSALGKAVYIGELKPGDLVFFSDRKGSKKIVHVGIITEVSTKSVQFIHASTSLGVVENELLTGYYRGIYVKARRLL